MHIKGSADLHLDPFLLLHRFPPPCFPEAMAVLAAPSPAAELETAPRDSKSEAAEQQRFLAKFVMLVFSKPEIQEPF